MLRTVLSLRVSISIGDATSEYLWEAKSALSHVETKSDDYETQISSISFEKKFRSQIVCVFTQTQYSMSLSSFPRVAKFDSKCSGDVVDK